MNKSITLQSIIYSLKCENIKVAVLEIYSHLKRTKNIQCILIAKLWKRKWKWPFN